MWVGVFHSEREEGGKRFIDMWMCFLPCLPLHFEVELPSML